MKKLISSTVDAFGVPLVEDAFDRRTALQDLKSLQEPIAEHLLLLFVSGQPENVRGWEKELNAWRRLLVRKNSGKTGKNNYTRQQLIKTIWEEPLGLPRDREIRLRQLAQEKGISLPADVSDEDAFRLFVERYVDSILSDQIFKK